MIDLALIKENKEALLENFKKRDPERDYHLDEILALDTKRRTLLQKVEEKKAARNQKSLRKPSAQEIASLKQLGEEIKDLDHEIAATENARNELLGELPNITVEEVVAGGKENNRVIFTNKEQPKFKFPISDHVQLAEKLKIIDYARAVKISGSGYWLYRGDGALLEWALLNYFISYHQKNNYTFIIPPFLHTEQSAFTSGHLPKFREDLFWTQDSTCLNATSEMMLGNLHRDEVVPAADLPLKYFAFSVCFRREAGGYRKEEKGMIRGHQFNKIEMFQLTRPEESTIAFAEMLKHAETLVKKLDLHFRTTQLAAGDCSAAMAKTCDIEVWLPSMDDYKEVSSVSNDLDCQARRGNIRFNNPETKDKDYVHTLNGSGLATSRILPAILEQNQMRDGRVLVPKVLRAWVGKKYVI